MIVAWDPSAAKKEVVFPTSFPSLASPMGFFFSYFPRSSFGINRSSFFFNSRLFPAGSSGSTVSTARTGRLPDSNKTASITDRIRFHFFMQASLLFVLFVLTLYRLRSIRNPDSIPISSHFCFLPSKTGTKKEHSGYI